MISNNFAASGEWEDGHSISCTKVKISTLAKDQDLLCTGGKDLQRGTWQWLPQTIKSGREQHSQLLRIHVLLHNCHTTCLGPAELACCISCGRRRYFSADIEIRFSCQSICFVWGKGWGSIFISGKNPRTTLISCISAPAAWRSCLTLQIGRAVYESLLNISNNFEGHQKW